MPMEETANMLLMLAGVVQRLKATDFLQPYWNVLESWAQYLNSTLPDPGNQVCSDVFVCKSLSIFEKNKSIRSFLFIRKVHHHIIAT
jgi:hypothetical protein